MSKPKEKPMPATPVAALPEVESTAPDGAPSAPRRGPGRPKGVKSHAGRPETPRNTVASRDNELPRNEKFFARVPPVTLAKINELARHWGQVKILSEADVVIECVDRTHQNEIGEGKAK